MLRYLSRKSEEEGLRIEIVRADMADFGLRNKVDFAFIMMGSLVLESNEKFIDHLDCVACSLKRGGLYFIQNKMVDWTGTREQSWNMEKEGIKVKTTFTDTGKQYFGREYIFDNNHAEFTSPTSEADTSTHFEPAASDRQVARLATPAYTTGEKALIFSDSLSISQSHAALSFALGTKALVCIFREE
jgi:hypothetical protein